MGGQGCMSPEGGSVREGSLRSRKLFKSEEAALGWDSSGQRFGFCNVPAGELFFLVHLSRWWMALGCRSGPPITLLSLHTCSLPSAAVLILRKTSI